jgi:uncharacterized protein YceK
MFRIASSLLLLCALGAGCSTTVATVEDGPSIYAGVRHAHRGVEWASDPAEGILWLCDIPLSAVADTVMLPVTIPAALVKRDAPAKHEEPAPTQVAVAACPPREDQDRRTIP